VFCWGASAGGDHGRQNATAAVCGKVRVMAPHNTLDRRQNTASKLAGSTVLRHLSDAKEAIRSFQGSTFFGSGYLNAVSKRNSLPSPSSKRYAVWLPLSLTGDAAPSAGLIAKWESPVKRVSHGMENRVKR